MIYIKNLETARPELNLLPLVIDGTVTFVGDYEVKCQRTALTTRENTGFSPVRPPFW
jgi:hypothetical protein